MTARTGSVVPSFAIAGISILVAVFTGVAWIGQPLRLVQLLTIVGVSMTAGVSLAQAVWRVRQRTAERTDDSAGS